MGSFSDKADENNVRKCRQKCSFECRGAGTAHYALIGLVSATDFSDDIFLLGLRFTQGACLVTAQHWTNIPDNIHILAYIKDKSAFHYLSMLKTNTLRLHHRMKLKQTLCSSNKNRKRHFRKSSLI